MTSLATTSCPQDVIFADLGGTWACRPTATGKQGVGGFDDRVIRLMEADFYGHRPFSDAWFHQPEYGVTKFVFDWIPRNLGGSAPSNDGTLQVTSADSSRWRRSRIAVVFGTGDTAYAVNGTAKSRSEELNLRPLEEVWADNPASPGTKIDVGSVIARGLELCLGQ